MSGTAAKPRVEHHACVPVFRSIQIIENQSRKLTTAKICETATRTLSQAVSQNWSTRVSGGWHLKCDILYVASTRPLTFASAHQMARTPNWTYHCVRSALEALEMCRVENVLLLAWFPVSLSNLIFDGLTQLWCISNSSRCRIVSCAGETYDSSWHTK